MNSKTIIIVFPSVLCLSRNSQETLVLQNLKFPVIKVGQNYNRSPHHSGLGNTASFWTIIMLSAKAAV